MFFEANNIKPLADRLDLPVFVILVDYCPAFCIKRTTMQDRGLCHFRDSPENTLRILKPCTFLGIIKSINSNFMR